VTAPRPLNCTEAFRRLDDYVDRELGPDDLVAVQEHLRHCTDCSEEFDTEQELLAAIRAKLTRIHLPADLMAKISARLRD
jgi:anti-sigma factor (TIGR02949 family)